MAFYSCSTPERVAEIEISAGNIIFDQTNRAIYVDEYSIPNDLSSLERHSYQQIITLATEAARAALPLPLFGFYFITETHILWNYDGSWHEISSTSGTDQQIYFGTFDTFPVIGESEMIYIDGTEMYRWIDDTYELINSGASRIEWIPR